MLRITKIFHFEMAHAIHGYDGACKNIHGHSYELHVTVSAVTVQQGYISSPGFIIDFKSLKNFVNKKVVDIFDHKIILSRAFLFENKACQTLQNLIIWDAEPTAENLLLYIKGALHGIFPDTAKLVYLKLFETKNAYAEWVIS